MKYDAMIIIDMQTALVEENPYNKEQVINHIKKLLEKCRAKHTPIIYIRHEGKKGTELEYGTSGWEIYHEIKPLANEVIIDKQFNSAFKETSLKAYLKKIEAKNIILCGMQVEYCVDTTCRVGFEYGYQITIPKATTTTYDNKFATGEQLCTYYENQIWHNRFAQVVEVNQLLAEI